MAAQLDDVVSALQEIAGLLKAQLDLQRESSDSSSSSKIKTIETAFGAGGQSSAGAASAGSAAVGSGGGGGASKEAAEASRFSQASLSAARQVGLSFLQSAADPLTPTASAGLSASEQLLTIVAGAVGGPKAADAAQALAGAAFNAGGGREAKFVMDNTISDLQSTIESMSAQGLKLSDSDLDSLVKGYDERNRFRFEQLARGAAAIDRSTGGALTAERNREEDFARRTTEATEEIARNTRNGGSGRGD